MICDPAQAGAAKAVADSVSNGIIPKAAAEDMIVIAKFLVHPSAINRHRGYVRVQESRENKERPKHPLKHTSRRTLSSRNVIIFSR